MTSASHRPQIRRTFAKIALAGCVTLLAGIQPAHAARDYVWAVGSSTAFPFATRVSEQFARKTGMKAPKVESLGTGGGIKRQVRDQPLQDLARGGCGPAARSYPGLRPAAVLRHPRRLRRDGH